MDKEKREKKEDVRSLTAEEERMCAELSDTDLRTEEEKKQSDKKEGQKPKNTGEKIAELYKNQGNNFQEKTFRKVHKIATDPNKMAKKEYKWLIKGISEGRIYVGGDLGLNLFNSLVETIESGSESPEAKEKKSNLTEQLKRIDGGIDADFINNKPKAKEAIKKLRGEETPDKEESSKNEIATAASEISKQAETLTDTQEPRFEEEQVPPKLRERIEKIYLERLNLFKKEKDLSVKLENERKKDTPNEKTINKLIKELEKIDEEIDKNIKESQETMEEASDYAERELAMYRKRKFFAKRVGFDPETAENITIWHTTKEDDDPTEGLIINEETGAATKKRQGIKIKRIYPNRVDAPNLERTSPGELMLDYEIEENGKTVTVPASKKNLLALFDTMDGFENYESTEEFNQQYGYELGYKPVEALEGESFTNNSGEKTVKVQKVFEKNGKMMIGLEESTMKMPRNLLPYSVDRRYYFDRYQKEFELGEFGVFLRKFGFQRDVAPQDLQKVIDSSLEAGKEECESFTVGMSNEDRELFEAIGGVPDDELKLPAEGKTQTIYFHENGKRREGKLKSTGDGNYELEYGIGYNDPNWDDPVKPIPAIAAVEATKSRPTVRKRKLSGRNLMEMANKGDLQNAQPVAGEPATDQPPQGEVAQGEPIQMDEQGDQIPKPPTGDEGDSDGIKLYKPPYTEEALPYKEIVKVGGMQKAEQSFLKKWWTNSRFLSVSDMWEFAKAGWEYYDRRWQRRQKEKYSKVGENLPFWAPEFQRINQAAENEEMGQFKESFDQKGVHEIIERLEKTSNRDEMKAALTALCEKGQMRWDNIDFWRNLNKFVDPSLAIPIPSNGDPATEVSSKDSRTGFDFLKDAIDSLWGEGQYNEWYRQQKSTYLSNAKSYYERGKELEGVEGGPGRRLSVLLDMHKRGEFVDPHEYEGLILFCLDYGKANMQEKVYYMIEGVAAENQHGNTILSFDRMAHINSEMLHKFPILEYLCATVPREDGGAHTFTIDDYKRWVRWFDEGDRMNTVPTKKVDEFLWNYAVPSDGTQNRINKDMRNGENLDHDDMFAFLPPASTGVVTDACKSTTGSKKFLTIEGYANVFPGFSQYFISLAKNNYTDKLVDAIRSYVRFEGIMTNKFEKAQTKAQDTYQRMDETVLNNPTIVSDEPPSQFIRECNQVVLEIAAAYGNEELGELMDIIFNSPPVTDVTSSEGKAAQNKINQAYYRFEEIFKKVVSSDGGKMMKSIIDSAAGTTLTGMPFTTPAEKAKRKAEMTGGA